MGRFTGEPVSFMNSNITGGFWKQRQDLFRAVTVDALYDRFKETGRFEAMKMNWREGMPYKPHIFWESDVTKWIEGAAYFLQKKRDPELEARVDELVSYMARTQEDNGYLNAYFTVVEPEARFTRRTDHELYCAGHLIEGAIAYAEATGKKAMLEVAVKYADLIDRVFRVEHSAAFDTPGHEEIELALMKLYDYTKEERYRLLAEYFINTRGTSERDETYDFTDQEHMQSHKPVRMQNTAEGHCVRALYLYSGMADLARSTKEEKLGDICRQLFENITERRMYITGGVGSTYRGESFTFDYDLPEYTAYNETCASIALALFCRRMWLMDADSRYADCAERALYNTALSGVSLSGDEFFYENPVSVNPGRNAFNESRPDGLKEHLPILKRVKSFDCSCCPPNLLRMVGSIADYMYSVSGNIIYAHCYMEAETELMLSDRPIRLKQMTSYPYEGDVTITTETDGRYTIAARIPGWCRKYDILVNGCKAEFRLEKGYAYVERDWKAGDSLQLKYSMETRLVEANPKVIDACGRAAVMYGPCVLCAEGMDHADRPLKDIRVDRSAQFEMRMEILEGISVPVFYGNAFVRRPFDGLYTEHPAEEEVIPLRLIPYFAWANRGITEMTTWFLVH
ncbi:MAG: glycoside hydrolase family 127 protein [Eisenbergiella sp.]